MVQANTRVQNVFKKKLKDWHLERTLNNAEIEQIMRALQASYDLGHADGFSDAWYQFNEIEEENGNL